jgi:DNA repair protein RadC
VKCLRDLTDAHFHVGVFLAGSARDVFMATMMKRMQARDAKSIIAFHNHPSGDPAPSREDIHLSRRLREAGKLLCIELLDHVIPESEIMSA